MTTPFIWKIKGSQTMAFVLRPSMQILLRNPKGMVLRFFNLKHTLPPYVTGGIQILER